MKDCNEMCSQKCIYFPNNYEKINKQYVDKNGLKHQDAVLRCCYDGHRIKKFEKCENFKNNLSR